MLSWSVAVRILFMAVGMVKEFNSRAGIGACMKVRNSSHSSGLYFCFIIDGGGRGRVGLSFCDLDCCLSDICLHIHFFFSLLKISVYLLVQEK